MRKIRGRKNADRTSSDDCAESLKEVFALMRKKFVAIVTCIAMLLMCFPVVTFAANPVKYWTWDDSQKKMVENEYSGKVTEISEYNKLASWGGDDDSEYWYLVKGTVTIDEVINVKGDVHLVLSNDCVLNAENGIQIESNTSKDVNVLSIYSQSVNGEEMGTINAVGPESKAGIRCKDNCVLNVYGGNVTAKSRDSETEFGGAGIGGNASEVSGTINIYGGFISAKGAEGKEGSGLTHMLDGAGIGGGYGKDSGVINIYGGEIEAQSRGGAAIGGGRSGGCGPITIKGGTITANSFWGAALGSGIAHRYYEYDYNSSQHTATIVTHSDQNDPINIYGGNVTAISKMSAGIGAGQYQQDDDGAINIYGGSVLAKSQQGTYDYNGHGIFGNVNIFGGNVTAEGNYSGIKGKQVIIQNGVINASGENRYGIEATISTTFSEEHGNAVIFSSGKNGAISSNDRSDWNAIVFEKNSSENYVGDIYGSTLMPKEDFIVPGNATLVIDNTETLIIDDGVTMTIAGDNDNSGKGAVVTNNGTIQVNKGGKIIVEGTLNDNGTLKNEGTIQHPTTDIPVSNVSLNKDRITLFVGQSETLEATISPTNATNQTVTWKSDKKNIAKVENGVVTAVASGTAEITVTTADGNKTASCQVTVEEVPISVTGVILNQTQATLEVGQALTLKAAVQPNDATNTNVMWLSSDDKVATVNGGVVKAAASGEATITVRTEDGGKTATCKVVVKAGSSQPTDPDEPIYPPTITDAENGDVTVIPSNPQKGDTVTITQKPDKGYEVDDVIVTDENGSKIDVTEKADGSFTFEQPEGKVTITVTFKESKDKPSQPTDPSDPEEPVYQPDITDTDNGTVSVTPSNPQEGDTVTITPKPDQGYEVGDVVVTDEDGNKIDVTEKADGSFTFVQPEGEVTITVTFKESKDEPTNPTDPSELPFSDVKTSDWFYDPVKYVYNQGLMTGTSATEFAPNLTTTRGMIVSILHRLEGGPVVENDVFSDVSSDDWYGQSVAWAASVGVVNGFEDGTFRPNDPITREQMAAILYNYSQYKGYDVSARADLSKYSDAASVSSWATEVLSWANAEGLVNGMTKTTLDPQASATRAQVATILLRYTQMIGE